MTHLYIIRLLINKLAKKYYIKLFKYIIRDYDKTALNSPLKFLKRKGKKLKKETILISFISLEHQQLKEIEQTIYKPLIIFN